MQAVAAEFSGCAENSTAFWREQFKNTLFRFFCFQNLLLEDAQRLFKSLLTRNEPVDS